MSESENPGIVIVSSIAREKREHLPPLIQDARENPLAIIKTSEGTVYVKPAAMPYTRRHMLIIPDRENKENTPDVNTTPDTLLGKTFQAAHDIADYYTQSTDVQEVDIGFNYSQHEDKKRIATQPQTLHVHVVGYDSEALAHRIDRSDALKRPDLKSKTSEPLSRLASELIYNRVLPILQSKMPRFFSDNFEVIEHEKRFTLKMKNGLHVLDDPEFPDFLKVIHAEGQNVYDEIAKCFFVSQPETGKFMESEDGRYQLLPQAVRMKRVAEYVALHKYLTLASQRNLHMLSESAKTIQEITQRKERKLDRELSEEETQQELNRFMAIKDFAYAAVFSGKQTDKSVAWSFGIDPVIFSTRDVLQASRTQTKLFERNPDKIYDDPTLSKVMKDESNLRDFLLKNRSGYADSKSIQI